MSQPSILFMIHCRENTGYAIEKLESIFSQSAIQAQFNEKNVLFSYPEVSSKSDNIFCINFATSSDAPKLIEIIHKRNVRTILAFDLPFPSWVCTTAKNHGVQKVISYWGASMSSLNYGFKLALKKVEYLLLRNKSADLYIFESEAMRQTATIGRGIPLKKTEVVHLGVDTDVYKPSSKDKQYARELFDIPQDRSIIFYSGHMEKRKGVEVLINCAIELTNQGFSKFHVVICGNKNDEEIPYLKTLSSFPAAQERVTFGGYRKDLPELMRSCDVGVIASTGWDSFTMSSLEMLASGLPLIVSNLQGLKETTVVGETGDTFTPGNHTELSAKLIALFNDPICHKRFSVNARKRALSQFSVHKQVMNISNHLV